jgi:uncharacterized UBP type Zn finger protein
MISGQSLALGTPAISLNGSAARGEHPDGLPPVARQPDNCQDCHPPAYQATLLVDLSCGWVACSDDSPGQHARAHYQETAHPVAARLESGSRWRLCYIHQRPV